MSPVDVRDLRVRRGTFTLDVPTFTVEPGTIVGLVGRNGAGKSTLLLALAGLLPVSSGAVRVFGLDPWKDPVAARRRLGWMSDDMPIWAMRMDQLLETVSGFYPTRDRAVVKTLITRLELDPSRAVTALSKGENTRLRLLLTLAFRPELVLLDEPATGLDVPSRRALLELVLGVVQDGRGTVIVSSHQVDDVERIADRIVLLERGRITADGSAVDVAGTAPNLEERLAGALS